MPDALKPLVLFLKLKRFGKSEQITFIDSTKIRELKEIRFLRILQKEVNPRSFGF